MNCPACGHENIDGTDRCDNCMASFRDLDVPRADSSEGLARSVMEDNLGQLEQEETITVASDKPALDVVRLMKNSHSGCALVLDGGRLVGIFTEHDVLRKMTPGTADVLPASARETQAMGDSASREQTDFAAEPIKNLMSPNPEYLHERDSVAAALNKMSTGRYRHIPVLKNDGSYTIASINSVLKYIAKEDW